MPENAIVTVRYGPYHACGVTAHRTQRLSGLRGKILDPVPYVQNIVGNIHVPLGGSGFEPSGCANGFRSLVSFALLEENGHAVELEEIKDWNAIELIVNGEQVYQCDIMELDYGGDGKLDDHCHKALEAVKKAY